MSGIGKSKIKFKPDRLESGQTAYEQEILGEQQSPYIGLGLEEATEIIETAQIANAEETAEYIATLLDSLGVLADRAEFTFLAYLLDLAQQEAVAQRDRAG